MKETRLYFTAAGLVPQTLTDEGLSYGGLDARPATLEEVVEWLDNHRWYDRAHAPVIDRYHEEWAAYHRAYLRLCAEQGVTP